jgi:hypothetical protein
VKADVTLTTIGDEVGLVANYSGPADNNYYLGRVVKTAAGHALSIQKIMAGVVTTLGAVVNVAGALTGPIKLQVFGTTLKLFMNDVEILSRTDGSFIRGSAGIRSIGTGTINNFSANALNFLPFADSFDPDALNPNWMPQAGSYTTMAVADKAKGSAALNLMTLTRFSSADVDVRAVIDLTNVAGRNGSLVARYTGSGATTSSMYLATVSCNGPQYVLSIEKRVNGVTTTLATKNFAAAGGSLSVLMRFTVIGGELKLYIAGAQELSAFDFGLTTGSVGIRSSLDSTFDNLSVRQAS